MTLTSFDEANFVFDNMVLMMMYVCIENGTARNGERDPMENFTR